MSLQSISKMPPKSRKFKEPKLSRKEAMSQAQSSFRCQHESVPHSHLFIKVLYLPALAHDFPFAISVPDDLLDIII
jgi:hypothetical protein